MSLAVGSGVPSVRHQVLSELFHSRGELAPELLRRCANIDVAHARVDVRSGELFELVSTEYRADAELRDRRDALAAAVIVEIQLGRDPDKRWVWPHYVSALRAQRRCEVMLMVLAPSPAIARRAKQPILMGHPGFQLTPIVLDFPHLPRIIDAKHAAKLPELAVLSAMAHPEIAVARSAIHALDLLPEEQSRIYWDIIMSGLPEGIRTHLEVDMIERYKYQTAWARKHYNAGHKEGREDGLQDAVLAMVQDRLGLLAAREQASIHSLRNKRVLTELIVALGATQSIAKVRALLESATSTPWRVPASNGARSKRSASRARLSAG